MAKSESYRSSGTFLNIKDLGADLGPQLILLLQEE